MNGLNYIIETGLLTVRSGALKVFLDFSNQDSYAGEFITGIGESGRMNLYAHSLGSSQIVALDDFTHIVKSGHLDLIGNRISEASGIASYVELLNCENMFTGNDFTFIVEGGKLPRDAAKQTYDYTGFDRQLPLHDKEIFFSNISGNGLNYSGWEFGLNGANLLYFRTRDVEDQKVLVFDQMNPYGENVWAVRHFEGNIDIVRCDVEQNKRFSNNLRLGSALKNGGTWYLNSGENSDLRSTDTGSAAAFTSSIRLRNFAYFDEFLSDDQIMLAAQYIGKDVSSGSGIILDTGYLYDIYETGLTCIEESGILYVTGVLSGYVTNSTTITGSGVYTGISGIVNSGDIYYDYCWDGADFYCEDTYTGESPIAAITGFGYYYETSVYEENVPVYVQSGVSGAIYEACETGYLETGIYFETTGYDVEISEEDGLENTYPRSVSYMGPRREGDFMEIFMAADTYSGEQKTINNQAYRTWASYMDGKTLFTDIKEGTDIEGMRFFLNGVAVRLGTGVVSKKTIDGEEYLTYEIQNDYLITGANGKQEIFAGIAFTGEDQIINLNGVYDIGIGGVQEYVVSGLEEYSNLPFPIQVDGMDIFFNGVKLYSGDSYYSDLGRLYINETLPLIEMTGIYFAWPKASGTLYHTGESVYDVYGTGFFKTDSVMNWINGIRKESSEYVHHDVFADLITGIDIHPEIGQGLFEGEEEV